MKTITALTTALFVFWGVGCSTQANNPPASANNNGGDSAEQPAAAGTAEPDADSLPEPKSPEQAAAVPAATDPAPTTPAAPETPDPSETPVQPPDRKTTSPEAGVLPANPNPKDTPEGLAGGATKEGNETRNARRVDSPGAAFAEFNRVLFGRIQKRISEKQKNGGGSPNQKRPGEQLPVPQTPAPKTD